MPKHPLKTCTHLPPHGDHDWDDTSERSPRGLIGNRYHCPGHPVLSQKPADSVANSIAIGKAFRERDERPAKGRDSGFARVP